MSRLVVLSNRIPTGANPSGGLVVALHDALSERGGLWIGSSGETAETPSDTLREIGSGPYTRLGYDLTDDERQNFYLGYANSVVWPLFHHKPDLIDLHDGYAEAYMAVNRRVAKLLAGVLRPDDLIWIHDYHFLPMAHELRKLGVTQRIGFFLHIPFPSANNIPAFPDVKVLPDWLAAYDLVGLQTRRDVAACLDVLRASGRAELLFDGRFKVGQRVASVASFPIGIDAGSFAAAARASDAGDRIPIAPGDKLVLGVDRLDYSKGLVHRFHGFNAFLDNRKPDTPRATLLQIAPPSREEVDAYRDIREELERLSGSINGSHAELEWTPIRYIRRPIDRDDLAGIYRRADVALVTPLADGMNLVAKEFVAAQDPTDPGVLILSPFAGAAEQMPEALFVNPYDANEMGEAIESAVTMSSSERRRRHAALLQSVMEEDIGWWTSTYLTRLEDSGPGNNGLREAS